MTPESPTPLPYFRDTGSPALPPEVPPGFIRLQAAGSPVPAPPLNGTTVSASGCHRKSYSAARPTVPGSRGELGVVRDVD